MALESDKNQLDFSRFLGEKHVKFCLRFLGMIPQRCQSLDSIRLIIAFFAVSSLDLMAALWKLPDKQKIIEWIYSLQVVPNKNVGLSPKDCGFRGTVLCSLNENKNFEICDRAHIAMTYTALSTLLILGDDLSRVDKTSIIESLKGLQLSDGSFRPLNVECENDMRFLYCASCICYILNDWSGIDKDRAVRYIKKSINYDGGIGQGPGLESHGGSTYCAVATLWLMGEIESALSPNELKALKRWLVFRQQWGFQGRPNKLEDSCYAFWVGATLKLLNCYHFVNYPKLLHFVLSTQDQIAGGIAKWPDYLPDMLHTYLGISGLSLYDTGDSSTNPNSDLTLGTSGLSLCDTGDSSKNTNSASTQIFSSTVHPALNISQRAADFLSELHKQ
ncbi:geranylgeranyl transferase type-1 subunit beta-like [Uloborus diversus]|uniref:geranylgeranyl transferase type-1 subunit beta-like n=1 Tax=Uloborus diversus TaxID=327109 RepID=UPI0024095B3E|nr:geranylgeranyl transferase type-1 subunit beta-like [Uloborus diversus]